MFLLKLGGTFLNDRRKAFTFHNVSIKTIYCIFRCRCPVSFTFHNVSIKTVWEGSLILCFISFTFHNVSIKTFSYPANNSSHFCFTFHNVSIKTRFPRTWLYKIFPLHSTMFLLKLGSHLLRPILVYLYIPQCFY